MEIKHEPLTPEEIDALEVTYFGPTWARNPDGKWSLPERTIGWQIAGWTHEYLNADATDENGEALPWKFTKEQLRFILWWYAVDCYGRFVYRKGVLQRLKGWGKDPLVAVMSLVELCGPSQFSHFDPDSGEPVGAPHPRAWVQIAAVSREQTRNTMTMLPGLMSEKLIADYGIAPGAELIRANGGTCRIEAVTSSYRALEGGRPTFVVLNETHHWVSGNGGHKMYETIDGNASKGVAARYLSITNAYLPGEDSVAERQRTHFEAVLEGKAVDVGVLYDSIEAHEKTPLTPEALRIVVPKIRGDARWLQVDNIIASVLDTTIPASRSRRMWLNQIVAEEDSVYGPAQIREIEDDTLELIPGDTIVMGFDGGKTDDATALLALRVSDGAFFLLGLWEKPDGPQGENWIINKAEVDSLVHEAFAVYDVAGFYADVALWETYIDEWAELYGEGLRVKASANHAIAWDMRQSLKRVTMAHERLMSAVLNLKVRFDGDRRMRRHMLNARRRVNNFGVSFGKESRESPRKVDGYAALLLAHEALHDLRTRGKKERKRTGRGYFM